MNQVWVFFKLIEVFLGSICMGFHVEGSMYWPEPIPHIILYCATFGSYTLLAALGAFRLLLKKSSILSSELLLAASAMGLHYFCGLLVMRSARQDKHLSAMNSTWQYLEHPHFARCKRQSIGALITGTMYLMHMFLLLDLLMRMEPGAWRRQATGELREGFPDVLAERSTDLFVLSKPVDDFLCRRCKFYDRLAHSQPLRFKDTGVDEEGPTFMEKVFNLLIGIRNVLFRVHAVESEESFLETPTITTSEESMDLYESSVSMEDGEGRTRHRDSWTWRGSSDSSSLWAKIEDWSTPNEPIKTTDESTLKDVDSQETMVGDIRSTSDPLSSERTVVDSDLEESTLKEDSPVPSEGIQEIDGLKDEEMAPLKDKPEGKKVAFEARDTFKKKSPPVGLKKKKVKKKKKEETPTKSVSEPVTIQSEQTKENDDNLQEEQEISPEEPTDDSSKDRKKLTFHEETKEE
ncbi:uncharacterized protein [Drosophila pseudoobscura]|uniref:DUF7775 domain-containing protein n=1 Tax=Drosophila pseudoobscura pseudoobscura TaxID=46245 RepID=A0A6I8UL61_DROPS|nr:uncharacterized protein LOC4818054 [Drosophila pseudoobscura]